MHIMDDDCGSKPAALDEPPRKNGSPRSCVKAAGVDIDNARENGLAKPENDTVTAEAPEAPEAPDAPEAPIEVTEVHIQPVPEHKEEECSEQVQEQEEEQEEERENSSDNNAPEPVPIEVIPDPGELPAAEVPSVPSPEASAASAVHDIEADHDGQGEQDPVPSPTEDIKTASESGGCGAADPPPEAEAEENKAEQDFLKGDENVSLPASPAEEEENSGASSPSSQRDATKRRKQESSDSESDTPSIIKKMKLSEFEEREREHSVSEYVENAAGTSLEELQIHADKLQREIHTLSALARAKEHEWNNIIRVKKIKEEMYIRLQRKKQVMMLMMGPAGKSNELVDWELSSDLRFVDYSGPEDVSLDKSKTVEQNCKRIPKSAINRSATKGQNSVLHMNQPPSGTSISVLKSGQNQIPVMMVPVVPSSPGNIPVSHPVTSSSSSSSTVSQSGFSTTLTRIPDGSGGGSGSGTGNREKLTSRVHRPILPKPTIVIPSAAGGNSNNGQNPVIGEGRQGPILDVRSIIADYRSKHPGDVPRRGRRMKSALSPTPNSQVPENVVSSTRVSGSGGILSMASLALGSGSQMRPGLIGSSTADMPDLGFLLNSSEGGRQDSSRPSSADSSRSGAPSQVAQESPNIGTVGGISFKDVLVQFAKLSQNERHEPLSGNATAAKVPPYPEVTLHPVLAPHSPPHQSSSSSLLHGILTKSASIQQHRNDNTNARPTTFSPTLARLLTAPERMPGGVANTTVTPFHGTGGPVSISDLLSTSKTRNEITITPVAAQQPVKAKEEVVMLEEEQEDSADRLVIDESADGEARGRGDADDDQSAGQDMTADDVPECQGCHQRAAQFVCAGCGNQWYCSRDCQVSAWDEHSEVCSG